MNKLLYHPRNTLAALKFLDLKPGATKVEIKSVYRRMALKYHPDKGGTNKEFQDIKLSYDYLVKHGTEVSLPQRAPAPVPVSSWKRSPLSIRFAYGVRVNINSTSTNGSSTSNGMYVNVTG